MHELDKTPFAWTSLAGMKAIAEGREAFMFPASGDTAHLIPLYAGQLALNEDFIALIADALDGAGVGRSISLTRLVDGESEYTLTYDDGSEPLVFAEMDAAYEHVRNRTRRDQARAVLNALSKARSTA